MKKILIHLAGIVFLGAGLIVGSCKPSAAPSPPSPPPPRDAHEIKIHLKAVKRDGRKHLKMYDSDNPDNVVVDNLETFVMPGDTVVWKLKRFSGIKRIVRISPQIQNPDDRKIMADDAVQIDGSKSFRIFIPDNAPIPSEREKYIIEFEDKRDNIHVIDPYLKIPHTFKR